MELPDEDTIRILITTDNHVGYNENDPITGDDSWKTFHEVMDIAKEYQVDMILQSGDLFHINKPTKKSMYQVMKSLRSTCMGNKPCELELLSDPASVFNSNDDFTTVNYEDPNFNISIPMFAISGNHDDATGDSLLCPMDLLHVSGLVNHFGKVLETDKIRLAPLLLQKGKTRLALYGLQSVREERLFRTFKEGGVTFETPTNNDDWFNIMCVHQNHTGHTNTAFLPEQFLPNFMDMIVWGHEHECVPNLVYNPARNFNVLQPGSSVATSLCDAEVKPKYVFILEINYTQDKKKPTLIPVPLLTVRIFKMKNITLKDISFLKPHDKDGITKFLMDEVEQIIDEANKESFDKLKQKLETDKLDNITEEKLNSMIPLPLIRLRVNYAAPTNESNSTNNMVNNISNEVLDFQVENPRRFSNRFVGRVANSNNIIQFYKKKKPIPTKSTFKNGKSNETPLATSLMDNEHHNNSGELQIEMLISDMLNRMQLSLLPEVGFNEAIKNFVDKDEKNALKTFIDRELDSELDLLVSNKQLLDEENPDNIKLLIKEVKKINSSRPNSATSKEITSTRKTQSDDIIVSSDDDEDYLKEPRIKSSTHTTKPTGINKNKNSKRSVSNRTEMSKDSIVISDEDSEEDRESNNIIISDDEFNEINGGHDYPKSKTMNYNKKLAITSKNSSQTSSMRKRGNISKGTTKKLANLESKTSKTPRTDILESFLARKRR